MIEIPEYEKLEEFMNITGYSFNYEHIAINQIAALLQYIIKRIDILDNEIYTLKSLLTKDERE